jgi:hypothetical protein
MDVTDDERTFGFGPLLLAGQQLVGVHLRNGLYAVKHVTNGGTVEYSLCNSELHDLYSPAKSLDDLRKRFRK